MHLCRRLFRFAHYPLPRKSTCTSKAPGDNDDLCPPCCDCVAWPWNIGIGHATGPRRSLTYLDSSPGTCLPPHTPYHLNPIPSLGVELLVVPWPPRCNLTTATRLQIAAVTKTSTANLSLPECLDEL